MLHNFVIRHDRNLLIALQEMVDREEENSMEDEMLDHSDDGHSGIFGEEDGRELRYGETKKEFVLENIIQRNSSS